MRWRVVSSDVIDGSDLLGPDRDHRHTTAADRKRKDVSRPRQRWAFAFPWTVQNARPDSAAIYVRPRNFDLRAADGQARPRCLFLPIGGLQKVKINVPFVPLVHMARRSRDPSMEISIDLNSEQPVFAQLMEEIKRTVLAGALRPGDPLPSIRQLATDLDLNNKTVAKAYRLLERDAVVETRGYRGTFVHADAVANSAVNLNQWTVDQLLIAIREVRDAGVTDSELRNAFAHAMNEQNQ